MSRKQLGTFGTSFLDLLSGALGAVIILFIIVPKMTAEQVDILDKVKEIKALSEDIQSICDKLKNSVSKDVFEQIKAEMQQLEEKSTQLQKQVAALEREVSQVATENQTLKELTERQKDEIEQLKAQLKQADAQVVEAAEKNRIANTVEKTLGVFAKFGILCRWTETNADVDIGVQKFGTDPEHCWRMYPSKKWGILGEDVRERVDGSEERFELFYVPQIYPEVYTCWVNIYERSQGKQANVECTLIFHPGQDDEKRYTLPQIGLTDTHVHCIVTFRLSDYGFEILDHREPLWGEGRVIK